MRCVSASFLSLPDLSNVITLIALVKGMPPIIPYHLISVEIGTRMHVCMSVCMYESMHVCLRAFPSQNKSVFCILYCCYVHAHIRTQTQLVSTLQTYIAKPTYLNCTLASINWLRNCDIPLLARYLPRLSLSVHKMSN